MAGETLTVEHYVDDNMRNIPDHYHAHARPKGGSSGTASGVRDLIDSGAIAAPAEVP